MTDQDDQFKSDSSHFYFANKIGLDDDDDEYLAQSKHFEGGSKLRIDDPFTTFRKKYAIQHS